MFNLPMSSSAMFLSSSSDYSDFSSVCRRESHFLFQQGMYCFLTPLEIDILAFEQTDEPVVLLILAEMRLMLSSMYLPIGEIIVLKN